MSVVLPINEDTRFRISTATDGQTAFTVPFPFQKNSDIAVLKIVGGVQTRLLEADDYTLTGAGTPSGGMIVLNDPAEAGWSIVRYGATATDRLTSIVQAGKYNSIMSDSEFDRVFLVLQEHERDIGRTLKSDFGVTPGKLKPGIAGRLAQWTADGGLEDGGAGSSGGLASVVGGANITVDNTDPFNPIINGVNAVSSVNAKTGAVVLNTDDISDATRTNKWATAAEKTKLGFLTVTGAVDLDAVKTAALAAAPQTTTYSKTEVDAFIQGLKWKQSVRVATTANGTLATAFANGQTVDGVTLVTGNRILLKNQTTASQNGIYVVAASGAPTRATDNDTAAEMLQAACLVEEGTVNADTGWVCTTNSAITLGTTSLTFAQFTGSGLFVADGTTLQLVGNTFSVKSGGIANSNLANMAASTIKGNNTGGAAAPLDMTVAQAKTLLAIALADITDASANGRSFVAAANYAAMRTLLGIGTSGQRVFGPLMPAHNEPPSTNYAVWGLRNGHPILSFPDATVYSAIFTHALSPGYAGGGLTVKVKCMCSNTNGTMTLSGAIERMDAATDLSSDSFATAQTPAAVAVPATTGQPFYITIPFTSGAQMDGLLAGEEFRLKLTRDTANDTSTGDLQILEVQGFET